MRPDSVIPAILSSVSGNTKELHLENMENVKILNKTLTNSWFYGEWIVKIIAKVMILIIHFVLHKKRRETMKDDKKEKSEQRYMERIRLIKDRVVNTRPEMDLENAKIMTESFKETAGEPLCIRKAKAFRRQCREKTVKIWDQELIVGCSGMIMKQRMR